MVTIKDVAKRAGVSIAAVSYALNDKTGVNEETKSKVKQIAEEMGYVPNSLAQGLLSRKTNIISLIMPDISNTYNTAFIKALDFYARKEGFFLLLGSISTSSENEQVIIDKLMAKKVDGFIITPGNYNQGFYKNIAAKLNKRNIPFVFSNICFPEIKSNYVVPDFEEGEYQITRYLLEKGFSHLAFIGGSRDNYYSEIRYKGFLRALDEFGITCDETLYVVCSEDFDFRAGYEAADRLLDVSERPEADVALNDWVAYWIIKRLGELNIKVPEDIKVVGFDDISVPTLNTVPLTTVRIPIEEMARLCIGILNETSEKRFLKQFILPTEVVVRD